MEAAKKAKSSKKRRKWKQNIPLLIMTLPGLIWLIFFYYIPVLGNVVAFKQFRFSKGGFVQSILDSKWVGFANFNYLFSSSKAYLITRNTVLYNLAFIIIGLIFAVMFAIILSQLRSKLLVKTIQTSMLLPYFLSWVIISIFVLTFLSTDRGLLNQMLGDMGMKADTNWYTTPDMWPPFLVFMGIWKGIGYSSIIYFATIVGIDRTYYEAAQMDGASKWDQIRHVVIPHLVPMMIILVILGIGNIFRADFGLFYQVPLQSGPLKNVTSVLDTYIYDGLKNAGNLGMTTAAGLYQSFVGFILLLSANLIVRKIDSDSALF